ncbi:class C beta-lactamase [Bordetella petrii]|uniref:class C beta-lactamase n=1 Tax=Bordetella petrii TaxID=94624 RepID=UPI0022A6B63B|nr:class C beta-lactamase [Bordetella petrii]
MGNAVAEEAGGRQAEVRRIVDAVVQPLMKQYDIPGMAVGVVAQDDAVVLNYGVQSRQTSQPVAAGTLFEVGSLTKTFTATLAAWAQVQGKLALTDPIDRYLAELQGTAFGQVALFHLATHTAGGLPLQVPDDIHDQAGLLDYFKAWQPKYPVGTYRTYGNPGIGTLGAIAARSLGGNFATLMQQQLLPALGMASTYIDVPEDRLASYAQGYTKDGKPTRLSPGLLWQEAYGVKTNAADMVRYLRANMGMADVDAGLRRALADTRAGYFRVGPMTQGLIWEWYAYPVSLQALKQGNSASVILEPTPVTALVPPTPARQDAWVNKTGSTNGFGAYVAFVPQRRIGIVLLANRNYPIEARVAAAHDIARQLDAGLARPGH